METASKVKRRICQTETPFIQLFVKYPGIPAALVYYAFLPLNTQTSCQSFENSMYDDTYKLSMTKLYVQVYTFESKS